MTASATVNSSTPKCSQCGTPLTAENLLGLCPACLLQVGAQGDTFASQRVPFNPPTVEALSPLFPQLEILELLGKGGMGAVYKARQKQLDRLVALKILPPGFGNEAEFAERFAREAKALAKLNHPNIVTLYEFGCAKPPREGDSSIYYFLMEFVDGLNLRQLLARERISPREALEVVPQICDALQFAHDQGIVHRDIKPENILLDRKGRVKVADFGLAKIIEAPDPAEALSGPALSPDLTQAARVMGTPNYMAPEQLEQPTLVDHRADIYALGVVFYQMLTGELPGPATPAPSSKVQIDVRLDQVVLRALHRSPEQRFQQVSEIKTQVTQILHSPSIPGTPIIPKPRRASKPMLLAVAAIVGVLLLGSLLHLGGVLALFLASYNVQAAPPTPAAAVNPSPEYDWSQLGTRGHLVADTHLQVDGRDAIRITNPTDAPLQLTLLKIDHPPITAMRYALTGEIKYEGVVEPGYLQMWNFFPPIRPGLPEGQYFTRTLAPAGSGPLAQIAGTSDWRPYSLPFDRTGTSNPPTRLEVSIFLPKKGTVWITLPKLTQNMEPQQTGTAK